MPVAVSILGSTGVIGRLALEVLTHLGEEYEVASLAGGYNVETLAQQVRQFKPSYVAVANDDARSELLTLISDMRDKPEVGVGEDGLVTAANVTSDVVVTAVVGARGLLPTWTALARGATIALANKETLVAAGDLVMPFAARQQARIVPVDSEHSALLQSLRGGRQDEVRRYILTASGGPFRTWTHEQLADVTVEQALRHPTWTMGQKITVDSATLMNKGLEVIEAHHLFEATYDNIDVLVHPQSIVHSLVEFQDGSVMAQLATHDMRLPIQYALTHPHRVPMPWPTLDLLQTGQLTFEAPDFDRFPALRLAYAAGRAGGYAPCVLNAANEVAVEAFLARRISFGQMATLVESILERHLPGTPHDLSDIMEMDAWTRRTAYTLV